MSLASTIRAAVLGAGPKAADNPAPEDEDKPDAAEPEDNKPDAEDDKPDENAEGEPDEKKPDASEGEPEDDMPEEEEPAAKGAAASERKRIGAITGHAAADRLPNLAAHLAFKTGLSGKVAGAILDAAALDAGSAKPGLAARMNGKVPALGGGTAKAETDPEAKRKAGYETYKAGLSTAWKTAN